jgi:hypothetical protein
MNFSEIILQLSIWSIIVPLVAGCFLFKKLDKPSLIMFAIVVLATIPQLLTVTMHHNKNLNIIYNLYTLLEFILMYLLFGRNLQTRIFRYLNVAAIIGFYTLAIVEIANYGMRAWFLNALVAASGIVYLVWIFLYILENLLKDQTILNPQLPVFWYTVAWLLYGASTSFVFSMANYIDNSKNPFIHNLWTIQGVFNVILYLFFAIGFYQSYLLRSHQRERT